MSASILISGIGRSGTTAFFQIVGQALLAQEAGTRCVYEPYAWNIPEVETTAYVKEQPYNVGQLGLFNLNVHCRTPLFLRDRHALHDQWLARVFGPVDAQSGCAVMPRMAKVIRGSGRLEAMLTRYQNLKVISVTRNPIDTINSSFGLFSFYGDELHPSDKHRFADEVQARFGEQLAIAADADELVWASAWWRYFSRAATETAEKFSGRVLTVRYEDYLADPEAVMSETFDFCGIHPRHLQPAKLRQAAGPTTQHTHLNAEDLDALSGLNESYFGNAAEAEAIAAKHRKRQHAESPVRTLPNGLTSLDWRRMYWQVAHVQKGAAPSAVQAQQPSPPPAPATPRLSLAEMLAQYQPLARAVGTSPSVGVLVTSFNNKQTIEECVASVMAQTRKPDLVLIADDASTDGSQAVLETLASAHPQIRLELRTANVGVAANRDLAIRAMDCDFVTTLDGDDLYFPDKLERELAVLEGREDVVAFSDYALIDGQSNPVQQTGPYAMQSSARMLQMLLARSSPVPRDLMFHRSLFDRAEGFDVGLNLYEDWALKMRLANAADQWLHSGTLGTAYDFRSMGLSKRDPVTLTYGGLLALSRNAALLADHEDALRDGVRTVTGLLTGGLKPRFEQLASRIGQGVSGQDLAAHLATLWSAAILGDHPDRKEAALAGFVEHFAC